MPLTPGLRSILSQISPKMSPSPFAIIAGVGPGTGASIARKFAAAYPVILLARNPANYEAVVSEINQSGGKAAGISADVSDEESMKKAFSKIKNDYVTGKDGSEGHLAAAVFNVGAGFVRKPFLELTTEEFEGGYKSNGLGAYLFSRSALPLLVSTVNAKPQHPPTLIFTGATASIRGSAFTASFATGKFALRALTQSLGKEFGPQGVHVAHAIIDGVIDIPRTKGYVLEKEDAKINADAIADAYWYLHTQPRTAFSNEIDIRPYVEKW